MTQEQDFAEKLREMALAEGVHGTREALSVLALAARLHAQDKDEALRIVRDDHARQLVAFSARLADLQAENERLRAGLRKAVGMAVAFHREGFNCDGKTCKSEAELQALLKEEGERG